MYTPAPLILPFHDLVPRVAADAFVAPGAVVVGDVEIGAEASVWYGCVLRGDVNYIRIGARSNIQDSTTIHVTTNGNPTLIGADVTVGHAAVLHACTLEDACFVGMRACLLDRVVVEAGGMVAAGALVTEGKRIRRGELWAGMPAKLFRTLSDAEMDGFRTSATHYVKLARTHNGGPKYP
jgi:gamma-carbonic anhydrase